MSDRSHIEWTDATWNPTRGCTKISPGCARCYADGFARRFEGVEGSAYQLGFRPRVAGDRVLDLPLSWRAGRRIFVDSMSDLFHEAFDDPTIDRVVARMLLSPRHTFQVLTKRPGRMLRYLAAADLMSRLVDEADRIRRRRPDLTRVGVSRPHLAPWIWWGVSVEDRRHGVPRIAELRAAGARVAWLSLEPLLESVDLRTHLDGIRWVVVGGEAATA